MYLYYIVVLLKLSGKMLDGLREVLENNKGL